MRKFLLVLMVMVPMAVWAQFAPAQDKPGTTAMHADSSAFVAWAVDCVAEPGPMNISDPSAGVAGAGWPASNVIGFPEGTMGVTCLGDGGRATVTFASPICNREGPDFAVFENGFANQGNPDLWFLELGFVEVSSDGVNFFRFPAISLVPTDTQVGGFACIDPSQIHNLASKYGAMYGTPFDLDEVPDNPLLDKNNITHVRIVDVVGCIQPEYCTYDSQGHIVNDPWPTQFPSCGMDLDAVGVIHDLEHFPGEEIIENESENVVIYPNPAHDVVTIETYGRTSQQGIIICDVTGRVVLTTTESRINVSALPKGVYFVRVNINENIATQRLIIK